MGKRMIFFFLALFFMGEITLYAEIPTVKVTFTSEKIVLDGQLKEKVWQNTPEYHLSLLNTGNVPSQKTVFKVIDDKNNLYFGIIASEDNMGKLKAEVTNRDGTVWADDDIEIFIDPWGKHQDYYQFAFNTLGTQFDLLGKEGGRIKTSFWNAFWQVKIYKGKKFWSAEVAIPFASLNLTGAKKTWYFNLCRERFTGRGGPELSTFAPLTGSFHQPAKFAALTGLRFDKNAYTSIRIGEVEASVYPEDNSWKVSLSLPVYSKKRMGKVNLEVLDNEKGEIIAKKEENITYGLNKVSLSFPVSQLGKRNLIFLAKNKEGRLLKSSFQKVKIDYRLVDVEIIKPFYRNSIYATQKEKAIEALFKINKQVIKKIDSVNILLISNAGKEIEQKVYSPEEEILFKYNAKNLPTGQYKLKIALLGKNGKKIGGKTTLISILPPPQNGLEVRIDKNLNVLINGKPFLAIGWYGGWWRSNLKKGDDVFTPEVNLLGRPYRLVTLQIARLIPGSKEFRERETLSKEAKKAIREKVLSLKNDPSLIGYYLADEPGVQSYNPSWLKDMYGYVTSLDPYRFCYITNNNLDGIVKYIDAADLLNPDPYLSPVEGQKITNMRTIKNYLNKIDEVGKGRKAKWVTLQAFSFRDWGGYLNNGRAPTYIEERTMWFLSLACGAKGFTPFIFIEYGEYPGLRIGIPYIHKEVKSLEKVILSPGKGKELKLEPEKPEITTWLKEYEGNIYIIAVNTSPDEVKVKLSYPLLKRYKKLYVISEDRVIPLKNGSFSDDFGYVATHVYTTNPRFPKLKNIKEVRKEIEVFRSRLQKPGNLAYEGKGTMLRASGNYGNRYSNLHWVVNGITDGQGWYDISRKFPAWLELLFPKEVSVGRVVIYTPSLKDYEVQGWNPEEGKWVTLVKVKNQKLDPIGPEPTRIEFSFSPIKTVKLRLMVYRSRVITEVNEWEVYAK